MFFSTFFSPNQKILLEKICALWGSDDIYISFASPTDLNQTRVNFFAAVNYLAIFFVAHFFKMQRCHLGEDSEGEPIYFLNISDTFLV
jgi:hypothetical protein